MKAVFRNLINSVKFKMIGKQSRKPSGIFGRMITKKMESQNIEFYKEILKELEITNGNRVFEIGYGTGFGINLIANNYPDCFVGGIDYSKLMYSTSIKRNQKFIDNGNVELSYGDLLTTKIDNRCFDKIFCINVIYFWSDLNNAFKKVYSMLNTEGIFCIYMKQEKELQELKFAEDFHKYSIEKVESELRNVGFNSVTHKLNKGYYIKAINRR